MKTNRRYLLTSLIAAAMVIAFLAGILSRDLSAKASTVAVSAGQQAALQGSYLVLMRTTNANTILLPLIQR